MKRRITWEAVAGILAATIILLAVAGLLGTSANATELPWPHSEWAKASRSRAAHHASYRKRRTVRQRELREDDFPTLEYRPVTDEVECRGQVRGLGTQWVGKEGAFDAAKKDWMERVRYDHGESFLDMGNAREAVSRCGRTSIGETMGQVMYRCEIVARPCKGSMTPTKLETK